MVAAWAAHPTRPIRGALLATPADVESPLPEGYPTLDELSANGWCPIARKLLPFPSIVVASHDDPLASFERVSGLAIDWGASCSTLATWATSTLLRVSASGEKPCH